MTARGFGEGREVKWGPLIWRSHCLKRVVVSTMSSETMALTESLGHLEWIMALYLEVYHADFVLAERER